MIYQYGCIHIDRGMALASNRSMMDLAEESGWEPGMVLLILNISLATGLKHQTHLAGWRAANASQPGAIQGKCINNDSDRLALPIRADL